MINPDKIEIEQRHRDAAAMLVGESGDYHTAEQIRLGQYDLHPAAIAFAEFESTLPKTGWRPISEAQWHPHIGDEVKASPHFLERYGEWANDRLWVVGISKDRGVDGLNVSVSFQWPVNRNSDGYTDGFYIGRNGVPDDLEPTPSHSPANQGEGERWRCFHCGDVFDNPDCARKHFGPDEGSVAACIIKGGAEQGLLGALRKAEAELADAWHAIHSESTDAAKAYYAQTSRHNEQMRLAEEAGYERGIADRASELATAEARINDAEREMRDIEAERDTAEAQLAERTRERDEALRQRDEQAVRYHDHMSGCDEVRKVLIYRALTAEAERDKLVEAARAVLSHRIGDLPVKGWLRDNDASRADLAALAATLSTINAKELI